MKPAELRDMTDDELRAKEAEFVRKLFNLRFQVATAQQDNTAEITQTKRDIARIQTILRERALAAQAKAPAAMKGA